MKKNLLAVAVLAASAFSSAVLAADGQVNFTGSITDVACEIDASSKNQIVDMGKIATTAFAGAGSTDKVTAGDRRFSLILKNCPASVTAAAVRFGGKMVPGADGVLALTDAADMAEGVGVQISDEHNNVINLGLDSAVFPLVSTADNKLNFMASYYALANKVTPGTANAVAQFTIVYQ
ncbi:fimbrial protein [Serratia rhizosphaerae]|uniref:Fimbrial protein n=1 Tax=Serratia rhizosphaerae TaxID=2597702 RepID=A0ABX6GPK0_9GAMM|nr:fimbrial protein [Serratia rhizosphaerae]MEB6336725.1 fimbrial protein [Serratia rhizosphaerae]QHA88221.1 fimbrial protein [Serratia rhizosphaerae]